jgi:hypothetical protein
MSGIFCCNFEICFMVRLRSMSAVFCRDLDKFLHLFDLQLPGADKRKTVLLGALVRCGKCMPIALNSLLSEHNSSKCCEKTGHSSSLVLVLNMSPQSC